VPLLSVDHIAKAYAGVPALKDASFELRAGEVHALMGENGAGKSTLIKILAGVALADSGTIQVEERKVTLGNPADSFQLGLRFIHQELNVVPQLTVAENILLGREYPRRFGFMVNWPELARLAKAALFTLGIQHIDPRKKISRLSSGDRMLVKIASAFQETQGLNPRIYVLDEPTASLNEAEINRLFGVIASLRERGCGIIYVSHRLDEIMRLCDRVTILRDGETCTTRATAHTTRAEIISFMTGRAVDEVYPMRTGAVSDDLAFAIDDRPLKAKFKLHKGEILGIASLENSDQRALLNRIMAVEPDQASVITLLDSKLTNKNPNDAWRSGFSYVPRERRSEGLILSQSVSDNITLPHLAWLGRLGFFLNRGIEKTKVEALAKQVNLKSSGRHQSVWKLSGGNQQKVVFARAIAGQPKLLLLDEPTRGVDVAAKFDIYNLLRELSQSGVSMILSSTDLSELIGMTDRILILRNGRLAETVTTRGLDQSQLLALCNNNAATDVLQ
jgi:ABC-type sugar transport system ATPase subunit